MRKTQVQCDLNEPFLVRGIVGQHLTFDPLNPPPLCNLYVQMLRRLGVDTSAFGSAKATSIPGFEAA